MPMYEYKCTRCAHIQDEIRPSTERNNPAICEKCESESTRNEVTRTFFDLKGNGWTDKNAGMK